MKKVTKLTSLLLALMLMFSLMSAAAFAEETGTADRLKEAAGVLAGKFLEDPQGSIDKIDKAVTLVDIGEDVLSVLYHLDRVKDTAEDARFEAGALRKKIKFHLDNIGKPDDPIAEAQMEIDNFVDRERHEKDQINEDIANINKLGGLLGKLTGKDIPAVPEFGFEPVEVELKPIIDGGIKAVLGGLFG